MLQSKVEFTGHFIFLSPHSFHAIDCWKTTYSYSGLLTMSNLDSNPSLHGCFMYNTLIISPAAAHSANVKKIQQASYSNLVSNSDKQQNVSVTDRKQDWCRYAVRWVILSTPVEGTVDVSDFQHPEFPHNKLQSDVNKQGQAIALKDNTIFAWLALLAWFVCLLGGMWHPHSFQIHCINCQPINFSLSSLWLH